MLYLDDIAKVLGSSNRAIAGLLQRKSLPFQTRKLDGKVVVDLIQVARYLAGEVAQDLSPPQKSAKRAEAPNRAAVQPGKTTGQDADADRYSVRTVLADCQQAYNCYRLIEQPEQLTPQEGLVELLDLLMLDLLPVDEPPSGANHIALWDFEARKEAMEPRLVIFDHS